MRLGGKSNWECLGARWSGEHCRRDAEGAENRERIDMEFTCCGGEKVNLCRIHGNRRRKPGNSGACEKGHRLQDRPFAGQKRRRRPPFATSLRAGRVTMLLASSEAQNDQSHVVVLRGA